MKVHFQQFIVPLISILLVGCAGLRSPIAHSIERYPAELVAPEKWILQSFTFMGKKNDTTGKGKDIWIAFHDGGGFSSFDGTNSYYGARYTATPDGKIHISPALSNTLVLVADPDRKEEITQREQLLRKAKTFVCTGDSLTLSTGTIFNQLHYKAQMPE